MGRVMQLASFSMAEVTYATGDIAYLVQEQAKQATFRVKAKQENVSGVVLPAFEVDRTVGSGSLFIDNSINICGNFDVPFSKISTSLAWGEGVNKS